MRSFRRGFDGDLLSFFEDLFPGFTGVTGGVSLVMVVTFGVDCLFFPFGESFPSPFGFFGIGNVVFCDCCRIYTRF